MWAASCWTKPAFEGRGHALELAKISEQWQALKSDDPVIRARDAADRLGVSEGGLAEARRSDGSAARLAVEGPEFLDFVSRFKAVGRVMTLTRNKSCVHETYGTFDEVDGFRGMGQVVGTIDLRLFFSHWRAAYAITEETRSGLRSSVQVFDKFGDSIIKVYATEDTDKTAWENLLAARRSANALAAVYEDEAPTTPDRPDAEIDADALREGWRNLEHSHDFHKLLRTVGAGRRQALRLAGAPLASSHQPKIVTELLNSVAQADVPIMVFVGNPGCIQIFSGPIRKVSEMGPWLNVMDPDFHMHLRVDQIASAWRVVKPTKLRGDISSLELFDAAGTLIAQIFGARPAGAEENPAWRKLLDQAAEAA